MAPVSTIANPSRAATSREAVDLPAPAGPSMATMNGRVIGAALSLLGGEDAHHPVLLVAIDDELLGRELLELGEVAPDRVPDALRDRVGVAVRAAGGLRDDLVRDAEAGEVLRGELQRLRRLLPLPRIAVEDRGAALRCDDVV